MDLGLSNAVVVVAGGTTGMGRAAADCFAADGARVAVLARTPERWTRRWSVWPPSGSPDAVGLQTDLLDQESVERPSPRWGSGGDTATPWSMSAGPFPGGIKGFEEYTDAEWLDVVDGITLSSVRTIRAALPLLRRAEWARIVNVSAMSTKRQSGSLVAYTAAKNALTSLTKNLSMSLAGDGILVNTVSPGTFVSESFKRCCDAARCRRGGSLRRHALHHPGLRAPRPPQSGRRPARRSAR